MEIFLTILAVLVGLFIFIMLLGYWGIKSDEKKEKDLEKFKKNREARIKKLNESMPIITARFNEVINKDAETRMKVLDELAETLGIRRTTIISRLASRDMYLPRLSDEEREAEVQQARNKREEKRSANYIADEYNKVIDKPEKIREKRIKQLAIDLNKSTTYIVKILRKKKCMDIPEI
jgi:hypothetical protein